MAQQVAWAAGKPRTEDILLAYEADTAAHSGRLAKAREFSFAEPWLPPCERKRRKRQHCKNPMQPCGKPSWAMQLVHGKAPLRRSAFQTAGMCNTERR